jgi:endoglucanase
MAENPTAELIKRLSAAIGVTGYSGSDSIQTVVAAELDPLADRVERDRMGSVVGIKHGQQPDGDQRRKIMLAAHLDELGAIVTKVDDGFIRFSRIGGLDPRVLMGQEVIVHGQRKLPGLIGSIPPHFSSPGRDNGTVEMQEMLIDVGLPPRDVARLVQVGDLISFYRKPADLQNGLITGKAMDNRASIAATLTCLQTLQTLSHQWDVYAVATATEESGGGYVGATTQAFAIRPDVAIAIDLSFADVDEIDVKLDKGPIISLGPGNHPILRKKLVEICDRLEIGYQNEIMPSGAGTDAYAIEVSRDGVPTILVSVPSRNMHTPVEVVCVKDIERIGRLLAHFIGELTESFVTELIPTD